MLGQEDPLEKEMETHSSILAWEISWTEEPGRLQTIGSQRVVHDLVTKQQEIIHRACGIAWRERERLERQKMVWKLFWWS